MATCESWQAPYSLWGTGYSSPVTACNTFFAGQTGTISLNGLQCVFTDTDIVEENDESGQVTITQVCDAPTASENQNSINCDAACTVAIELKAEEPDAQKLSDMSQLWGLFLVVLVAIYCAKQMLKFFESTPHE